MADSPVAPSTGKHPRLSSLRSTTEQGSPVSTRQRQLGQIGGKSGPGYSPYARRVATRLQAQQQQHRGADEDDDEREGEGSPTQQPRQAQGLFGRVRSLPGRMLGLLTRSSSSKQLAASTSLADVRAELDGERQREERQRGQGRAGGITRSKTSYNIAQAKIASQQPPVAGGISSSSSMSALSTLGGGPAAAGGRSAHSTLVLPNSASTNGSGAGPSFLTAANLGRHSRAASPALSSASLAQQQRRSPSPLRNGLVGSMSSFQLAQPPSPTSASAIFNPTLGNGVTTNPFGLTSRSPFVSRTAMQPRSPSVSGRSVSSVAGGAAASTGHPLFPYSSTLPRGTSPSLTGSVSMRDGLSSAAGPVGQKRPFRAGSPLNPQQHFLSGSATVGSGLSSLAAHGGDEIEMLSDETGLNGVERARKKQLVWDPQRGLVSRERLEKEKEREAPPMPKNEAERILEVLEGMGRTPLGEAKRGTVKPKHINVPAAEQSSSRLPRSSTTPSILSGTPYAARASRTSTEPAPSATQSGRPAKGLQAVLRAREERRRALIEQEREERERERMEDEERERERERRRRERRRRMDELVMSDEMENVFSAPEEEEEVASPKRVTRSAAKQKTSSKGGKGKERLLEPPTPSRRSTRASSRAQTKSPSPAPTPRRTRGGKAAPVEEEQEDEVMGREETEQEEEQARPAKRSTKSRSPAPPPSAKKRSGAPIPAAKSPSPPPPQPTVEATPAVPKITFPAPSSFPATAPSTSTGRSSLRPGKSHTSRQHASSSRVFSAKEEDLPLIDDEALAKIQMPAFKIPAGFSFGAPAVASSDKKDEAAPAASSSSLLSRLGAPASTSTSEPAKPAFSFGAAPAAADKPAAPLPTFSFGAPAAKKDDAEKEKEKPASTPADSDFFAKPATSAPSSSGFSFSAPTTAPSASATTNGKPNFFASILADKEKDTPAEKKADEAAPKPAMPAFSFGAITKKEESLPVIKPTEVVLPTPEAKESAAPPPNPFAAFGKPAAEESKEGEEKKDEPAKTGFSFGAPAATEKKEEKKDTPAPLFSFGAPKTDGAAASSPFSFGGAASKPADKPAASPFSFGSASTPASTETKAPAPTFTFGTTPATPQADEKKDSTPGPAPLFGGLSPAKAAVTDDADGDSGMEDEGGESSAAASPAPPAAPAFSFGAASSSAPSPFGASTGSTGFTFGASTEKKDAPPASPFGAPAASPSLFGGAASTASKPSFSFGASPSASPAPPSPAATAPSFSFGTSTSTAGAAPSPFAFGAQSSAPTFGGAPASSTPAPFTFGSATPSPAPGTPTGAPASTGFTFGAPTSTGMGQSLSASSATAAPSFSFGAPASQPATPGAAPASPFTFGAGTTTGAIAGPGGAAPFAFGASASTPGATGGFTFGAGAPASAPGTPGATGGGLFNIGSGGNESSTTGPGGRPVRPLRRTKR